MNRQFVVLHQLEASDFGALELHHVFGCLELKVIGDANGRHHVAEVRGHLTANSGDAPQQGRVLPTLHQLHQTQADFDRQRLNFEQRLQVLPS